MNAGGTHLLLLQGLGEFGADDGELGLVLIELPLDVVEPVQVRWQERRKGRAERGREEGGERMGGRRGRRTRAAKKQSTVPSVVNALSSDFLAA